MVFQTPDLKIGTVIKIDNTIIQVESIHKGYIVGLDKKKQAKVYSFDKVESAC